MNNIKKEVLFEEYQTQENTFISLLKSNFPNCFDKNGNLILEKLTEIIDNQNIPISKGFYTLNWLGKSYAKVLRDLPPETLLAEDKIHNEKSENKNSQNLLIKGDNLEVLKHLKSAYFEQIKMIYIDPPYNTGSDGFVYQDDRKFTAEQLAKLGGLELDEAQRVLDFTVKKSNSHSAWLTFMYPRLYIARQLLRDDGVIFISIDDNEQAQLKLLCDEVFGEDNFVNQISVKTKVAGVSGSHLGGSLQNNIEYGFLYCKNHLLFSIDNYPTKKMELNSFIKNMSAEGKSWKYTSVITEVDDGEYIKSIKAGNGDEIKVFTHSKFKTSSVSKIAKEEFNGDVDKVYYKYINQIFRTTNAQSSIRQKIIDQSLEIKENLISIEYIPTKGKNANKLTKLYYKDQERNLIAFLKDVVKIEKGIIYKLDNKGNLWDDINYNNLANETGGITFSNGQKPLLFLSDIINLFDENSLILDFFAGSGTTAHAVMQLNAEDNGNRQFICVQLAEPTKADSEAHKAGFDTIFDITKARIEKAAAKIQTEHPDFQGDLGFKIFETVVDFRQQISEISLSSQIEMPNFENHPLSDSQKQILLTTWRTFDGQRLTADVQAVDLGNYFAYFSGQNLYLLDEGFGSNQIKALIERLDNDTAFLPTRIVLYGNAVESSKQKELKQALDSYANKKSLHISLLARY